MSKTPQFALAGLKIELAEAFFVAMQRQKITAAILTYKTGICRTQITDILSAKKAPTLENICKIATALNLTPKIKFAKKKKDE